ncbi:MAG: VWA domain-containing protein [Chloroflexi bacterium]|nr:VWA domain-containing protein [Chloroflexota bacterium]
MAVRPAHRDLTRNVLQFGRLLRANDLLVTPSELFDSLRAMRVVDLHDRTETQLALRTVLTARVEDLPVFDQLFDAFWRSLMESEQQAMEDDSDALSTEVAAQQGGQTIQVRLEAKQEGDEGEDGEDEAALYSPVEVMVEKDFSSFQADEMADIAREIMAIARKLATKESRRTRTASKSQQVDPRRTMRKNLKYGGTIVELARKTKKIRKPRIVLICDVSRSMDSYSRFLLQFIHAFQNSLGRVESFVFSTSLTRVTDYFKHEEILAALDRIASEVHDWSGGTRIGQSLRTFNQEYGRKLVDHNTIVLILSDGLDTGDAEVLGEAMEELAERACKVIWLNPLLGSQDYRPLARGMSTALPHVDVFAPAHNLASLKELSRHLSD